MAEPRVRRRSLWLVPESTYGTDPGSGYAAVPAMDLGDIADGRAALETARFTGRVGMTPRIPGPDSATYGFGLEAVGLGTPADAGGESPPAVDYFDHVLGGIGQGESVDAFDIDTHSGTSLDMGVAGDVFDAGDLLILQSAGGELRAVPISVDLGAGAYTLAWDPGITATVVRGVRRYTDDDGTDQTHTLYSVYDQGGAAGQQYSLPGCRITSASWSISPEAQAKLALELFGDSVAASAKGSLAAQDGATANTPLRVGTVYVNGVAVDYSTCEVAMGLDAQPYPSAAQENSRSNHLLISSQPTVTIVPAFTNDLLELKRNQTQRSVVVQIGSGSAGCLAFYAPTCQVAEATRQDVNGVQRLSLQFSVMDAGPSLARWQWVRS